MNKSGAERAEVCARCSKSGGLLSIWQGTSGVALIDSSVHKVDAGRAGVLAHDGASAWDKRKRCGAASLAGQERSAGAEAREGRGVQIGVVRTVRRVRWGLANCDGSGVDRC